jgi:cystathionine beta-lyase/cystathionine gamma-synthase
MSASSTAATKEHGFATRAIHAGNAPDPTTGAVSVPIYQTSTYAQPELGKHKGFEYSRTHNPTRLALETNLAALENGTRGFAFGSGMAAITTIALGLLRQGDHLLASNDMYGGTFRVFNRVLADLGVAFTYVDTSDLAAVEAARRPTTRALYVETPTNPMMKLSDLRALAAWKARHGIVMVVDNTFMTPFFQRPLDLGADIVMHSTTKYLNGHSDMVGGAVIVKDPAIAEKLAFLQNAVGAVPGPFDCWLVLRGTKTLALRMRQHDANARRIAEWLERQPMVTRVLYPGLASHPQHALAQAQQDGFGGMISFEVASLEAAKRVMKSVRLWTLAESLGGVESLVCHPLTMTHASVPPEERARTGLTDALIRLSVGVEDADDLIADLEQALSTIA